MASRARGPGRVLLGAIVGGVLVAGLANPVLASPVHHGIDYFTVSPSTQSLVLPAGFFGSGSIPYSGVVLLRGAPLDPAASSAAMEVRRVQTARFHHPFPSDATIPIEIVALSLQSVVPITVMYGDGTTKSWEVSVGLSASQSPGSMTITHANRAGGTWDATLPVVPVFTFTSGGQSVQTTIPWNLIAHGVPWQHKVPKSVYAFHRFCPSCMGGSPQTFVYSASTMQLKMQPAFTAA